MRPSLTERRCFYSTFIASLIDPVSWQQFGGLAISDIADEPLPLKRAMPARATAFPDIIVIQHESIFDPRIFGLPVEPSVDAFLSPPEGRHGQLNVDIFGGGSWQSEFSLLTGLVERKLRVECLLPLQERRGPLPHQPALFAVFAGLPDDADLELPPQLSALR